MNIYKKIVYFIGLLLITFFICFEVTSNTTLDQPQLSLPNSNIDFSNKDLLVGYGKSSIIPKEPVPLAGYGIRNNFDKINDSIFVRTILLSNKSTKLAFITLDLMLITPNLANQIKASLLNLGINNVYFSASHTHSSIGGYGEGFIGKIILAGSNSEVINNIVDNTVIAVKKSIKNQQKINSINFKTQKYNNVKNRVNDERNVDQKLRNIIFITKKGKSIRIISGNAHPTIISHKTTSISNDYPGQLCLQSKSDFTMFMAGTMGSITPIIHNGKSSFEKAKKYASTLLNSEIIDIVDINKNFLTYQKINTGTHKFGLHITEYFRLRNWLFNLLFGDINSFVDVVRVGSILFISLPVELSGEYYPQLENYAFDNNLHLVLTTFNGTYLGYAPPSNNFKINHRETREMNWLGKYGGDYFNEVIKLIIQNQ